MEKPKLKIPIKQKSCEPITIDNLRVSPENLAQAETPETVRDHEMKSKNLPKLLSISQAVEATNLSYEYLRYLCYSNKINHLRCGRKYMIDPDSLAEYIRSGGIS